MVDDFRHHKPSGIVALRVLPHIVWVWRRGRRYGTLFVDLEQNKVVPDRQSETLAGWPLLRDLSDAFLVLLDRHGVVAKRIAVDL